MEDDTVNSDIACESTSVQHATYRSHGKSGVGAVAVGRLAVPRTIYGHYGGPVYRAYSVG
jgi:hypothetical protein